MNISCPKCFSSNFTECSYESSDEPTFTCEVCHSGPYAKCHLCNQLFSFNRRYPSHKKRHIDRIHPQETHHDTADQETTEMYNVTDGPNLDKDTNAETINDSNVTSPDKYINEDMDMNSTTNCKPEVKDNTHDTSHDTNFNVSNTLATDDSYQSLDINDSKQTTNDSYDPLDITKHSDSVTQSTYQEITLEITQSIATVLDSPTSNQDDFNQKLQRFILKLSRQEQVEFSSILYSIRNIPDLVYPTTQADMRRLFLDGKDSLPSMITRQFTVIEDRKTSHVTLKDIFTHFLSRPYISYEKVLPQDLLSSVQHPNRYVSRPGQSQRCITETKRLTALHTSKLYTEDLVILFINVWSDGFDPNDKKVGKEYGWVQTVSVLPDYSDADHKDSSVNTFVVTLGNAGSDRQCSQRDLINSLNELSYKGDNNLYWVESKGKYMRLYLSISSWLADQPERRSYCSLLAGNSTLHTRWGYIYNLPDFNVIAPCQACTIKMMDPSVIKTKQIPCTRCICWDYSDKAIMVSFTNLRSTFKQIHMSYRNGGLTKVETRTKLHDLGLNRAFVEESTANTLTTTYPPVWDLGMNCTHSNNDSFAVLDVMIDAPMHLLALGLSKAVLDIFLRHVKSLSLNLDHIITECFDMTTSLKISWLHIIPLQQQYVSENYLSVSRIGKWISSVLGIHIGCKVHQTVTHYKQLISQKPCVSWTTKEMRTFLKDLGVNTAGNRDELLEKCSKGWKDYLEKYRDSNSYLGDETLNILQIVELTTAITSRVLQQSYNEDLIDETRNCILCLLTKIWNSPFKNEIEQKYNYLSLLNLPMIMRKLGPLKFHWEGSFRGEKVLSIVKNNVNKNSSSSLWKNTLRKCLVESYLLGMNQDSLNEKRLRSSCRTYLSYDDVYQKVVGGKNALCASITTNNVMYMVLDSCASVLRVDVEETMVLDGATYFSIKIHDSVETIKETETLLQASCAYMILLPLSIHEKIYYLILSNTWKQLHVDGGQITLQPYTVSRMYPSFK